MKLLHILVLLTLVSTVSATGDINTTNVIDISSLEDVGGTDYIVPHQHYWDSWFSVYNDGSVSYSIYMYQYSGNHPDNYTNAFIGIVRPNEVITLNSNASYRFYADYDDIQDFGDIEMIEKKFNQYWLILIIGLVVLIGVYAIYRKVRYQ